MILIDNFWSTVYHFFMNRYYVSFLLFFKKAFTFQAISKRELPVVLKLIKRMFLSYGLIFHRVHEPY